VAANTAKLEKMSWAERIKWKGDFRYRYQPEEAKGLVSGTSGQDIDGKVSRNRQRIRARASLEAQMTDTLEAGFGLASGGDNPVSANATLGGGGSKKDINLDLAYFDWNFAKGSNLAAGKFKNRFTDVAKTGFLWDSDWRPEGFDIAWQGEQFYATGLGTWLSSDNSDGIGSKFSYGAQVGWKPSFGIAKMNLGVGYWKFKAQGQNCFTRDTENDAASDDCFGNTKVDPVTGLIDLTDGGFDGVYLSDLSPVELFGRIDFGTGIPFGLFADFAKNSDAKTIPNGPSAGKKLDTAYAVGVTLGKAKKQGGWDVKAYYQDKEADSVVGLLTDSDFAGGGSDSKGWAIKGTYKMTDNTHLRATYLKGERQDSNGYENGSTLTSDPYDVNIWQMDLQFKYK
jgi:hypothetical protein